MVRWFARIRVSEIYALVQVCAHGIRMTKSEQQASCGSEFKHCSGESSSVLRRAASRPDAMSRKIPPHPRNRCARSAVIVAVLLAAFVRPEARASAPTSERASPQGHFVFRSYGANDGLVNSSVTHLLQDTAGFIWAGTDDGLYRYDGYRFDRFSVDGSAAIVAQHEDREGVLWVGTRSGLSRWTGTDFESVPNAVAAGDSIRAIADGPEGLWLASANGLQIAGPDLRFQRAPGWSAGEATALWQGRKIKGLWAAHWDGQARVLQRTADEWRSYALANATIHERIDALAEDGQGRIWARSATQLWAMNAAGQAFERVATPIPLAGTAQGYLAVGRRGDLWVPTNDAVMHRENGRWTENLGGAVLGARPVLEDQEGSLWFGARGLHRLSGRGIFHAYDITEGLPGSIAWSIARDRADTLWVGTERGLARVVDERFESIPGTESQVVRSIAAAANGTLYLAGIPGNEVLSYDPVRQQVRHHPLGPEITPGRIFHLLLDRQGMLWASTDTAGLIKADTRDTELHFTREPLPDGGPKDLLRGLHEDAAGRLWVAGLHGLAVHENGQWRRLRAADGFRFNEFSYVLTTRNGDLLAVYRGSKGFVRARYENGILRVLRNFETASTRSADEIFIIGEDANDHVWVGTGRSIELYTPEHTGHFDAAHGLLGEDTASMAFLAEPNGDVWIGVVGGLMRFDAAAYRALPQRTGPPAGLLDVHLGDRAYGSTQLSLQAPYTDNSFHVRFAGLSFLGGTTMQYRTQLEGLETADNITEAREAHYSALHPGRYRFKVAARAGTQGPWGAPATFAFRVLPAWWQTWWARVLFGLSVALGVLLVLRWRFAALRQRNRLLEENVASRTAELSQANTQLHSEMDVRRAAENAVQQRNVELEALNQKLVGTQSQLLQSEKMASVGQLAAGVAHEINNPIGFVHSNLAVLKGYVEDIFQLISVYERLDHALPRALPELEQLQELKQRLEIDYLRRDTIDLLAETLDGVTRVKKIVQDLKDFSHVDEAEWQRVDVHQCLDSTLNMLAHELKYKIKLVKNYSVLPPIVCLPFQLNQVFVNLLMNAAQAIDTNGTITIGTTRDAENIRITISDTGGGIDPINLKRIFEPFYTTKPVGVGTGLGLSVTYGIIQRHNGSIEVASELGDGTTFTIRLPITGNHEVTDSMSVTAMDSNPRGESSVRLS